MAAGADGTCAKAVLDAASKASAVVRREDDMGVLAGCPARLGSLPKAQRRGEVNGTRKRGRNGPPTASSTRQARTVRGGRSGPSVKKAGTARGSQATTPSCTGEASNVAMAGGSAAPAQHDAQALQDAFETLCKGDALAT